MGSGSERLRHIADVFPSSQSGTSRKKIICTKKIAPRFAPGFFQFLLSLILIKKACFRVKVTSKSLIKKIVFGKK